MRPFEPIVSNPHLLTIASNFWPRRLDTRRFPVRERCYQTEETVQVLAHEQRPEGKAHGELILLHGLEGSSAAGYMVSMAQAALEAGYAVCRLNMRSCGGAEHLSSTLYHAGLTCDLKRVLEIFREERRRPVYVIGFSLGGNVVLKLAGELGEHGSELLDGVCGVSAPIDLKSCVEALERLENYLYARRFIGRLKARYRRRSRIDPERFPTDGLERVRTVFEFDDRFTAPCFGFQGALHYYETQSCSQYLDKIAVPALVIQAKDDPMIPFRVFSHPAFERNHNLKLLAVEHGGHLGFLSRSGPRFWLDSVVVEWVRGLGNS